VTPRALEAAFVRFSKASMDHEPSSTAHFGPEVILAINCAYRSVLEILDEGADLGRSEDGLGRHAHLAKILVDLARAGEHSEARLRTRALFQVLTEGRNYDAGQFR
jgi:hypothetical protein